MSKMPAKKKSCFQITSVTQAQVVASSITDDTESLDDPDESRTEDVSSEIFDVSRADFEPEVCDISSSEETLNSVAETEAPAVMASYLPQDVHMSAVAGPPNGGFVYRNTSAVNVSPRVLGGSGPSGQTTSFAGSTQQPTAAVGGVVANVSSSASPAPPAAVSTTTTTTTCSSRFRVIKLDHGTGEPFKRGRWTCTEFYERDSEGSAASRTVDGIKHAVTLDHNADRDSGLGVTGGSVAAPVAHSVPEPATDSGYMATPHAAPVELQQQSYGISHPGPAPQNLIPPGHNGMHQGVPIQHMQKSPSMPPSAQAQQFPYSPPPPQQPVHNLPSMIPASQPQPDYRQQHQPALQPPGTTAQTLPVASLPVGTLANQGPSPVMTPAAGAAHVLGLVAPPGEAAAPGGGPLPVGQPAPAQVLLQQHPGTAGVGTAVGGVLPLQTGAAVPQQPLQPAGPLLLPTAVAPVMPHAVPAGAQNVPAAMPSVSNLPQNMPNQAPAGPLPLQSQPQAPRAVAQAGLGLPGLPASFSQPSAVSNQADENRRKSDALPQPSVIPGKDAMKPLVPESLHLSAPAVNSLFGIAIPIDGDEDSASGASVVAIDNKIEQAMDLVKSHLMYAVREEVEVLKEQIKELYERNSVLERENAVLKSLANTDQLTQLNTQLTSPGSTSPQQPLGGPGPQEGGQPVVLPQQPNISSA